MSTKKGDRETGRQGETVICVKSPHLPISLSPLLLLLMLLFSTACEEIKPPKTEPFVSEKNAPPPKQEFRWSNGKMPKSFDPARASAAPETDLVRALFEGLTEVDAKDLKPLPALATKWTPSADYKTWTFQLRQDAKWSNGEPVTAQNLVDSWKRLAEMGDKVPQRQLLKNIVGMDSEDALPVFAEETSEQALKEEEKIEESNRNSAIENDTNISIPSSQPSESNQAPNPDSEKKVKKDKVKGSKFGVEAVNTYTIKVNLIYPDQNFPNLVAHPIFHPIYGDGKEFEKPQLSTEIVTNGAFRLASISKDGVTLERSKDYWNKDEVKLETVKFVATENAEQALARYRAGEIDVVSNANFTPLALKLLKTYEDLRQTKHSALSFYEFNPNHKPFDDPKVREALAIAIERERLTQDEMDGSTQPAADFLPFSNEEKLKLDVEKAKELLSQAGFANGENFRPIKLLINRNDLQIRIANAIRKMWKKHLNIETEIDIKDSKDFQNAFQNGEFDIARRGIVLPTNDETANMLAMFEKNQTIVIPQEKTGEEPKKDEANDILNDKTAESNLDFSQTPEAQKSDEKNSKVIVNNPNELILTEAEALEKLPAIPLYFPMSYSLVKPYVKGFETNPLDAPSLKKVEIDNNWQPNQDKSNSK